ncbi:uncharacterized protein [Arachis hypogaea]|uniref:uncharacterized protein n=1 Tax=Arachis hypogaea TaxID=3818 RepID=UPI003B21A373
MASLYLSSLNVIFIAEVIEQSGVLEAPGLMYNNTPAIVTSAIGQMAISKGRQGREAQNIIKVYLANLRLKGVDTDVLVTAYKPILIKYVEYAFNSNKHLGKFYCILAF